MSSWINDVLIMGKKEAVVATKEANFERFSCDDAGEMKETLATKLIKQQIPSS